jgi:hypothetical protein
MSEIRTFGSSPSPPPTRRPGGSEACGHHHTSCGSRADAILATARPTWLRQSTPSLAHGPGRPHASYRAEVPERRIGPDGDADGPWGIPRGRVTMLRPKFGTARLSVLRSRYSPPVRPEGAFRELRANIVADRLQNCMVRGSGTIPDPSWP